MKSHFMILALLSLGSLCIAQTSLEDLKQCAAPDPLPTSSANDKLETKWFVEEASLSRNPDLAKTVKEQFNGYVINHYHRSVEMLENAKAKIQALQKLNREGSLNAEDNADAIVLNATLKLKQVDYTLWLPEVEKDIDAILKLDYFLFEFRENSKDEQCSASGIIAHVASKEEIYNDPSMQFQITWCYDKVKQWENTQLHNCHCFLSFMVHELHHAATRRLHLSTSLGDGYFLHDSYRFSNMVLQLNMSQEDWETYKSTCGLLDHPNNE